MRMLVRVPGITVDCMIRMDSRCGFRFLIFSFFNPGYCVVAFEIIIHLPTVGEFSRSPFSEVKVVKEQNLLQFTINWVFLSRCIYNTTIRVISSARFRRSKFGSVLLCSAR